MSRYWEMAMGVNVKFALGSALVCGVLLVSGCGGSSSATASAGWNPPRPSGVPDDKWASVSHGHRNDERLPDFLFVREVTPARP
jgi:hypothetical protein